VIDSCQLLIMVTWLTWVVYNRKSFGEGMFKTMKLIEFYIVYHQQLSAHIQ